MIGIVIRQTLVMFLYMMIGFLLFRTRKITAAGSRELGTLLLWLVIPAVIINSFCVEFSLEKLRALLVSGALGAAALVLAMLVAKLIFPKCPIDQFAAAFSNAGFMGIPIVQAALGTEAVFYMAGFTALLNILQWTYGVWILSGDVSAIKPKKAVGNPIFLGTVIGVVLFCTGLGTHLPDVAMTAIKGVASLNAPMAMMVLGVYLAQADNRLLLSTPRLYLLCLVRLLLIPALTLGLLLLVPAEQSLRYAVLIAAAAPVGANVAVYAQQLDLDYPYACQTVALSTVFSILSFPLILAAAQYILQFGR